MSDEFERVEQHDGRKEVECPTTARVIRQMENRAAGAMTKFGVPMKEAKQGAISWLRELQEELLDAAVYIEAAIELMMVRDELD